MAQTYGKRLQPERNAKGSHGTGRIHALRPQEWANAVATDYWANFGDVTAVPADAIGDLDLYGWTTASYVTTIGDSAGFLDSDTLGTTGGADFNAAGDFLLSPAIFGDHAHATLVEKLLGFPPASLNMELFGRLAANANEEESGFGFVQDSTTGPFAKADLHALITSDGTNFSLESSAAVDPSVALDNTTAHLFRIQITSAGAEWFIDDVTQGSIALVAATYPAAWGASTKASTGTNDPVVQWVHIWYE